MMSKKQEAEAVNEIEEFYAELEANKPEQASRGPQTRYDTWKTEFGTIYRNYALVSFNDLTSPLGTESTVLRMVALDGNSGDHEIGRRVKVYLTSYERNDFYRYVKNNEIVTISEEDADKKVYNLPVTIDFLRDKQQSTKHEDRQFKVFSMLVRDTDSATIREALPEIPADQIAVEDPEE
jgi:hypothetical protein